MHLKRYCVFYMQTCELRIPVALDIQYQYQYSISILNFIGSTSIICSGAMCMHVDYSIFVALTGS
jgi:hypothetical protein